jgi:hypothetical protein
VSPVFAPGVLQTAGARQHSRFFRRRLTERLKIRRFRQKLPFFVEIEAGPQGTRVIHATP